MNEAAPSPRGASDRPVVLVVNKIDHEKHEPLEADFAQLGFDNSVAISSAHGRGITTLLELVDALLPQSPFENRQSKIDVHGGFLP